MATPIRYGIAREPRPATPTVSVRWRGGGEVCRYDASLESFFLRSSSDDVMYLWLAVILVPATGKPLVRSVVGRSEKWRLAVPAPRPPYRSQR
jgi:hypothetical protein